MTLEQGTLLNGRYRIVDILGQGGMGSVYRAMDENLGVEVAVKENLFTTDEYARQFRLEAVILASLRHANLPRVMDHFVFEGQGQYLVMDYIEGEDLRQRMERQGTITDDDAILIGAAMCDALGYLHTRKPPVLHRDIKPGNVKITPDGHVYLVDFGLAKLVQGSQTTTTGARAMTPGYSPPEQYGTARTDPRSDIYSLGATLYAALTGVIPEDGLARVMDNIQLTPIRKNNTNVSRRLASAIEKAMEAYPDDRYQNAEEFRRALLNCSSKTQRLVDLGVNVNVSTPPIAVSENPTENPPQKAPNSPLEAIANSLTTATMRMRRRVRKMATSSFWIGLLVVALIGGFIWMQGGPTGALLAILPANIAQTYVPAALQSGTPTLAAASTLTQEAQDTPTVTASPTVEPTTTLTPTFTVTPLGGGFGQYAFASDRTGIPQVYMRNLDGSGLRQLSDEPDGACQPDWSPDGMRLVYISPCRFRQDDYSGSSLYIINVDGTGREAVPTTPGGDFEPDWSPDGKRIAFTSVRDGYYEIYAYNLESKQVERITDTKAISASSSARQPAWNPFSTQLVYVLKRVGVSQIWVTTSQPVTVKKPNDLLVPTSNNNFNDFLPVWSPDGEYIVFNQTNADGNAPAWLMRMSYEDRGNKQAVKLPIDILPVLDISFSPDGFWMIFESKPAENAKHDIYLTTVTGSNRQRLTTDPGFDFDPAWRPVAVPLPPTPIVSPTTEILTETPGDTQTSNPSETPTVSPTVESTPTP